MLEFEGWKNSNGRIEIKQERNKGKLEQEIKGGYGKWKRGGICCCYERGNVQGWEKSLKRKVI